LLYKRITVGKSKEINMGQNLAESSKDGCGSKGVVLPMMKMNNNPPIRKPEN
jgi:hypothetical protein